MTLDEAIKHAEEVDSRKFDDRVHCIKCAEEHRQLVEWLKELKQLREQESCDDAISRQAVIEYIEGSDAELGHSSENELVCQDIKELPPVTPQPKTGHWIYRTVRGEEVPCCSRCGLDNGTYYEFNFCPECGANMIEPQESEDKDKK